jgi:O-antigen/teichoic acid export membrane protein
MPEALTHRALKNISYNLIGYGVGLLFALFVTPLLVKQFGYGHFGLYVFLNTLLNFAGLLDLGVATAATKYIAEFHGNGQHDQLRHFLKTVNSLVWIIGGVGLLLFIILGTVARTLLPKEIMDASALIPSFVIAGCIFFVSSTSAIGNSVPYAIQRIEASTIVATITLIVSNITLLTIVLLGGGVPAVLLGTLMTSLGAGIAQYIISRRLLSFPLLRFGWDWKEVKRCYGFGLLASVSNSANSILLQFDRLLIPAVLGPAALTFYSLPGNIAGKIQGITANMSNIIFPFAGMLQQEDARERLQRLYVRAQRLIIPAAGAIAIPLMVFSKRLLSIWVNPEVASQSWAVQIVLCLVYWILAVNMVPSQLLLGSGRVKTLAWVNGSMAILNLLFLFLLTKPLGIMGAALAYLFALIPSLAWYIISEKYVLGFPSFQWRTYLQFIKQALLASALTWIGSSLLILPFVTSLITLLLGLALSAGLFLFWYWFFGFIDPDDWHLLFGFGKTIVRKVWPFRLPKWLETV